MCTRMPTGEFLTASIGPAGVQIDADVDESKSVLSYMRRCCLCFMCSCCCDGDRDVVRDRTRGARVKACAWLPILAWSVMHLRMRTHWRAWQAPGASTCAVAAKKEAPTAEHPACMRMHAGRTRPAHRRWRHTRQRPRRGKTRQPPSLLPHTPPCAAFLLVSLLLLPLVMAAARERRQWQDGMQGCWVPEPATDGCLFWTTKGGMLPRR